MTAPSKSQKLKARINAMFKKPAPEEMDPPAMPRDNSRPAMNEQLADLACQYMSDYIRSKGIKVTLATAGGFIALKAPSEFPELKSRSTTKDLDGLTAGMSQDTKTLLAEAARHAEVQVRDSHSSELPKPFYRDEIAKLFVPEYLESVVMFDTFMQNIVCYEPADFHTKGGLRILAAPMDYCAATKAVRLARLTGIDPKSNDVKDCAAYIRVWLRVRRMEYVGLHHNLFENWIQKYRLWDKLSKKEQSRVAVSVFPAINDYYKEEYENDGIVLEGSDKAGTWFNDVGDVLKKVGLPALGVAHVGLSLADIIGGG
ncbi:MAG: hypothetical protein M1820_010233 [Bogoriella megaspora]|nr:MAG: hypothetical protein M1820_010233 [Bogoriella megaspora]